MTKVTKKFDNFLNENYYESSPTMVPGQGVGPGLFPGGHGPEFFNMQNPRNIEEKDVPQIGPNGETSDPDYMPPSQNTHAEWQGQIQLGDVVEDVNPECRFKGSWGKAFAAMGSGDLAMIDYIIANEGEGYALGEVARVQATSLKLVKKHQMNG